MRASPASATAGARALAQMARRSASRELACASLATIAAGLLPLAIALTGKRIVDAILARSVNGAVTWVSIELGCFCLSVAAQRLLSTLRAMLQLRLAYALQQEVMRKTASLPLTTLEDTTFLDDLSRLEQEAHSRPVGFVMDSASVLQGVLTVTGAVLVAMRFSGWLALALCAAAAPSAIHELRHARQAFRHRNAQADTRREAIYLGYALLDSRHAKEMVTLGLGESFVTRRGELVSRLLQGEDLLQLQRFRAGQAWSFLAAAAFYGAYLVLVRAAASGVLTLGFVTLYILALRQAQQAFQSLVTSGTALYEHALYGSTFARLLAREERTRAPVRAPPMEGGELSCGLHLEDVGFRYPGADVWTLRHLTLRIPPGQRVAVVGENGAGKSTLVKLLIGLYHPTEGRILLDGKDLRHWEESALRARFSVLFQDFNRYDLSVRENVGLGSVSHVGDEARIWRALAGADADQLVRTMSSGLQTRLGVLFPAGHELSGGQWQRIALARTIVREDADIVVLDEPTAALDAHAEAAFYDGLWKLAEGKIALIISHRLSTARLADQIVVLSAGTIIEEGNHRALMRDGGTYARLYAVQAESYQ